MRVDELRRLIAKARDEEGRTPLYVNATAGTTVLGSFDPFLEIAEVAKQEGIWMHVDASWGGGVAFSNDEQRRNKLAGVEKANSVTFNPHKMLGVPVTCSFLLCHDMRVLHRANTMAAGYLFHGRPGGSGPDGDGQQRTEEDQQLLEEHIAAASEDDEVWDLADLTLQCGRRGDALKLALAWTYYGRTGLGARVDAGFSAAAHLAALLTSTPERRRRFVLVSEVPLPCLQVCFYYAPIAIEGGGAGSDASVKARAKAAAAFNTARTRRMVHSLVKRGFMVDYAPGDMGEFFRVVVNGDTRLETVEGLVKALEEIGDEDEARERAPNGELGMQRRTD